MPEPAGPLAQYPIRVAASASGTVDILNATRALWAVVRDAANDKAQAPQRKEEEPEADFRVRSRRELAKALAPLFTRTSRVVPGGLSMRSVTGITYPTPNGMHTMSVDAVKAALVAANRPFITDLLPDDAEAPEVLAGYTYEELDEMRCALVAVSDLVSRGIFDENGRLTGLARRDMRKHYQAFIAPPEEPKAPGKGKAKGPAPPPAAAPKAEAKPQRNLRALLLDLCQTTWPFTPPDKSAVTTLENDPSQPRHKPLFRATVNLPAAKRVFQGPWQPTKRDAENAASEQALTFLTHFKKK